MYGAPGYHPGASAPGAGNGYHPDPRHHPSGHGGPGHHPPPAQHPHYSSGPSASQHPGGVWGAPSMVHHGGPPPNAVQMYAAAAAQAQAHHQQAQAHHQQQMGMAAAAAGFHGGPQFVPGAGQQFIPPGGYHGGPPPGGPPPYGNGMRPAAAPPAQHHHQQLQASAPAFVPHGQPQSMDPAKVGGAPPVMQNHPAAALKPKSDLMNMDEIAKSLSAAPGHAIQHPGPVKKEDHGPEGKLGSNGAAAVPNGPPGLVVSLEEVAFFLEDMGKTVWWLIKAAKVKQAELENPTTGNGRPSATSTFSNHRTDPNAILLRGDEELPPDSELSTNAWYHVMETVESNVLEHVQKHENQLRSKMFIVVEPSPEQRDLLEVLKKLRFNCGGRICVFDIPNVEVNHKALWQTLQQYLMEQSPGFAIKADLVEGGTMDGDFFMQCLSIVPYIKIKGGDSFEQGKTADQIKLYCVFHPDKKRKHWSFVSQDLKACGAHENLGQAAHLMWHETVGVFYQWTWTKCFKGIEPFLYVAHEKEGSKYPVRPYLFVEATPEFYEMTTATMRGEIPNPEPGTLNCIRHDEIEMTKLIHTDGYYYKAHDECNWLDVDWDTGRLSFPGRRGGEAVIRRDLELLFKQQPRKLWAQLFGKLLEKTEQECATILGKDLPTEPPFAIQLQGIDKAATDEDIVEFFKDGAPHCNVTVVTQMEEPRHSARIEFADQQSLRAAMRRHNEYLKRRKVKIELWHDGMHQGRPAGAGKGGEPIRTREQAEYCGPLPTSGPYKLVCRNLERTLSENDLGYFFWDRDCEPKAIVMEGAGKHTAIVEFATLELLKSALKWNGVVQKGREVSVSLWDEEVEQERAKHRIEASKGAGGPGGASRGGDRDHRDDYDREHQMPRGRNSGGSFDRDHFGRGDLGSKSGGSAGKGGGSKGGGRSDNKEGSFRSMGGGMKGGDKKGDQRGRKPSDMADNREKFKNTKADVDDNWRRG